MCIKEVFMQDYDLQACLSVQQRSSYPVPNKITQELASELLSLVNDDSAKAMAIIKEIMYYSPNKSVEWYCERAIYRLNRQSSILI